MILERNLEYWKKEIFKYDEIVEECFKQYANDRKNLSESLIYGLRNFVDAVVCYIREFDNFNKCLRLDKPELEYQEIEKARSYCGGIKSKKFLPKFIDDLNSSVGHKTFLKEYAERIFYSFVERLIKIKEMLKKEYSIDILNSIDKYPLDLDNSFYDYYAEIIETLSKDDLKEESKYKHSYYILKKKMIYIKGVRFFEYTMSEAIDNCSKFNRFIAFSLLDIPDNYAIQAKLIHKDVLFLNQEVEYSIITSFKIAIRPCEFIQLFRIFSQNIKLNRTKEYWNLMNYLQENNENLSNVIRYDEERYVGFVDEVFNEGKNTSLYRLIYCCRKHVSENRVGSNVLLYLLFKMNNTIIKRQLPYFEEDSLVGINLHKYTYSFDQSPFSSSLKGHNPKSKDLFRIFNFRKYEHEILAKKISLLSDESSCIYIPIKDISSLDFSELVEKYNSKFSKKSLQDRLIIKYGESVFINGNEEDTIFVLNRIIDYCNQNSFAKYQEFIQAKILELNLEFDDQIKKETLLKLFSNGNIFAVYGFAGAGKSYFAKYVLEALSDLNIFCIATTNAAVDNMVRKFQNKNATYKTITKYLDEYNQDTCVELLIIDECSTISTKDMRRILSKTKPKFILLLGDTYQISSISFGNWFSLLKHFIDSNYYVELGNQFRAGGTNLKQFWDEVRKIGPNINSMLSRFEISKPFDKSIFERRYEDEIILCLNYDGLYGINNINKLLQKNNPNKEFRWKEYIFKVDDKILFIENTRFKNIFYNNLKGKILAIDDDDFSIKFTVKVDRVLSSIQCEKNDVEFIENIGTETVVKFVVNKHGDNYYDQDTTEDTVIPFQIAYAIVIHKAQGLEYDSVKIIVSNEVEEEICHNIFYTAITRAKKDLTIYWTIETQHKIVESFMTKNVSRDANILSSRVENLKILKK